jgi:hypothetical protein
MPHSLIMRGLTPGSDQDVLFRNPHELQDLEDLQDLSTVFPVLF